MSRHVSQFANSMIQLLGVTKTEFHSARNRPSLKKPMRSKPNLGKGFLTCVVERLAVVMSRWLSCNLQTKFDGLMECHNWMIWWLLLLSPRPKQTFVQKSWDANYNWPSWPASRSTSSSQLPKTTSKCRDRGGDQMGPPLRRRPSLRSPVPSEQKNTRWVWHPRTMLKATCMSCSMTKSTYFAIQI